jgi:hypothetical protein
VVKAGEISEKETGVRPLSTSRFMLPSEKEFRDETKNLRGHFIAE